MAHQLLRKCICSWFIKFIPQNFLERLITSNSIPDTQGYTRLLLPLQHIWNATPPKVSNWYWYSFYHLFIDHLARFLEALPDTFKVEGEASGSPTLESPIHQTIVTGSGGPAAAQTIWKGALGMTDRSSGSTVKKGTPRRTKQKSTVRECSSSWVRRVPFLFFHNSLYLQKACCLSSQKHVSRAGCFTLAVLLCTLSWVRTAYRPALWNYRHQCCLVHVYWGENT